MDEELVGEVLSVASGDLAVLIDALAKASKEHDRFVTVTITIAPNDEVRTELQEQAQP